MVQGVCPRKGSIGAQRLEPAPGAARVGGMPGEDVADDLGAVARGATLAVALPEQPIAEALARAP